MSDTHENHDSAEPIHDELLGKLALSYKLITPAQYLVALEIQKKEEALNAQVMMGDVLFSHGFLSSEQLEILNQAIDFLARSRKEKRFGNIAVKKGFIRRESLNKALDIQKKEKKEIGRILIEMGCLTEGQRQEILEIQKNTQITVPKYEEIAALKDRKKSMLSNHGDFPTLKVSPDALIAVVVLPEGKKDTTLEEINTFLDSSGVTYGRMPQEYLRACLASRELGISAFIVAQGQKGQPHVAGPLIIHFSPRALELSEPADPPQVRQGTVLGERELSQAGIPRITVFGVGFDEKGGQDFFFINGVGARISEARDRITAACDGEPFMFTDGSVGVIQQQTLEDPGTLPVRLEYDGHVLVKGCIPEGSEIRCVHVTASDIEGAVVWAEGDVRVSGQLVDSKIVAAGTVSCDTVRNSTLSCLGDIHVTNDILDSQIETACRCVAGKSVISSSIRARRGFYAEDVVSSDGAQTHIESGVDLLPAMVRGEQEKMKNLEMDINEIVEKIHAIESMINLSGRAVSDIMVNLKKTESERELLDSTVTRMEQKGNRQIVTGRNRIAALDQEIQAAKEVMDVLEADCRMFEKKMMSLKKKLQIKIKIYRELKGSTDRKTAHMMRRLEALPPRVVMEIRGEIDRGTVLSGPGGSMVLDKTCTCVEVREQAQPDGSNRLVVQPLA